MAAGIGPKATDRGAAALRPASSQGPLMRGPRGFSLVEILVVFLIIAVLLAVLLPALQGARETARRLQCASNLRQVAKACELYHNANNRMPPSAGVMARSVLASGRGWIVSVLPYIEEMPLYQSFGQTGGEDGMHANYFLAGGKRIFTPESGSISAAELPSLDGYGDAAQRPQGVLDNQQRAGYPMRVRTQCMRTVLPLLQCPSDTSPPLSLKEYGFWDIEVAVTDYKGNAGNGRFNYESGENGEDCDFPRIDKVSKQTVGLNPDNGVTTGLWNSEGSHNGVLFPASVERGITASSISDGLATTFLVGEDVPDYTDRSAAFFSHGDHATCFVRLNHKTLGKVKDQPYAYRWKYFCAYTGFRSEHRGGANFAMADGSTRFVDESIDLNVYRAMGSRNGGELVPE